MGTFDEHFTESFCVWGDDNLARALSACVRKTGRDARFPLAHKRVVNSKNVSRQLVPKSQMPELQLRRFLIAIELENAQIPKRSDDINTVGLKLAVARSAFPYSQAWIHHAATCALRDRLRERTEPLLRCNTGFLRGWLTTAIVGSSSSK